MKLLNKLNYKKADPFRDATLFVIICEGAIRETQYFDFFDRLSERIKVHSFAPENHKSSPNHVLDTANHYLLKYEDQSLEEVFDTEKDQFWLVMDTDHHSQLIHDVIKECEETGIMKYAISNPCFEVWLRFHVKEDSLDIEEATCQDYKKDLNNIISGGFESNRHPSLISIANVNAEKNLKVDGYLPLSGSTTLHQLGKEIYSRVKSRLSDYNP